MTCKQRVYLSVALYMLLGVSAWGQKPWEMSFRERDSIDNVMIAKWNQRDTLHDPSAKFDTLYWRWERGDSVAIINVDPTQYLWPDGHWERIPGRWDTVKVRVYDTVWVTHSTWTGSDGENDVPGRCQHAEVDRRDSLVVTPKAIRFGYEGFERRDYYNAPAIKLRYEMIPPPRTIRLCPIPLYAIGDTLVGPPLPDSGRGR